MDGSGQLRLVQSQQLAAKKETDKGIVGADTINSQLANHLS